MKSSALVLLALLLAMPLAGCIPSNVVARDDRMVFTAMDDLVFEPAVGLQLAGFFTSTEITGDVAQSLRWVAYYFVPDGTYTAAALVDEGETSEFQTLSGSWRLTEAGLALDGADPVTTERSGDLIRLTTKQGRLVLRAEALQ